MSYLPSTRLPPNTGGVATPHERDGALSDFLAQLNGGISGENIPDTTVTAAKLGTDEYQQVWYDTDVASAAITLSSATHPGSLFPIPDSFGFPWHQDITIPEDGDLHVCLSGSALSAIGGVTQPSMLHVAIEVDGRIIGHTDILGTRLSVACYIVDCRTPISAGRHHVRFVWGWGDQPTTSSSDTVTFYERVVFMRWVGR